MNQLELLNKKKNELSVIESKISKINGVRYKTDEVAKYFPLGRVGGSGRNNARLNRQRERDLDKTIDNAKKSIELEKKKNVLLSEISRLESGTWKSPEQIREIKAEVRKTSKQLDKERRAAMTAKERLFIGIFPGGTSYADKAIEQNGDYKKIAFKSNTTGEVTWYAKRIPADLRELIENDMNS